jgi:hypothetical protein
MPGLTAKQALNLKFTEFQELLQEIEKTFFSALEKRPGLKNTSNTENTAVLKAKLTFTNQENKTQRELLNKLSELKLTLFQDAQAADIDSAPISEVLGTSLKTCIDLPYMGKDLFGFIHTEFSINTQPVTARYAIEILMPKILLLQQFDILLQPALNKLTLLEKKKKAENQLDGKYAKVYCVASEMVEAARQARQQLADSDNIQGSLQSMRATLSTVYTENNEGILAEHRGNEAINAALNMLNQCIGYIMFALTYPNRYFDDAKTQAYVDSWFEPRVTQSFYTFNLFKEKMMSPQILDEAVGVNTGYR